MSTRRSPRKSPRRSAPGPLPLDRLDRPAEPISRTAALAALGPVVYAAQLDGDLIKIGRTSDLVGRLRSLRYHVGAQRTELLAVLPGSAADEAALHERLVSHRAQGREYYHPMPEVMAVVEDMRARMGRPCR